MRRLLALLLLVPTLGWCLGLLPAVGVRPIQNVATGGNIPINKLGSIGGNFACRDTVLQFRTGNQPAIAIATAFTGTMVFPATLTSESSLTSNVPVAASLLIPAPASSLGVTKTVPFKWNGIASTTIPAFSARVDSDYLYPSDAGINAILPNSLLYMIIEDRAPNGQFFPIGRAVSSTLNESSFFNDCGVNNLANTTTTLTQNGSYSASSNGPAVAAMPGRYARATASALCTGDSIAFGLADNLGIGTNGGGFLLRAMTTAGMTCINQATSGMTVSATIIGGYSKRQAYWPLANAAFIHLSINDIIQIGIGTAGYSTTTIRDGLRQLWGAMYSSGLRQIVHTTPGVYTDSIDNWMTQVNQTSYPTLNSPRDTVEAQILSDVGSFGLYGAIKMRPTWAISASGNNWLTAASGLVANFCAADSVHPNVACNISGSSVVAASTTLIKPF